MNKLIVVGDQSELMKNICRQLTSSGYVAVLYKEEEGSVKGEVIDPADIFLSTEEPRSTTVPPLMALGYGLERTARGMALPYGNKLREEAEKFILNVDYSDLESRVGGLVTNKGMYPLGAEPDKYHLSRLVESFNLTKRRPIKPCKRHCKCSTCKGNKFTGFEKKGRKVW